MSLHSPQNAHTHTTHMYPHPRPLHTFPMYTPLASPHKHAHRHTHSTCTPTSPITHTQLAHNLSPYTLPTHPHTPTLLTYTFHTHQHPTHAHVSHVPHPLHTHIHTHIKTSQSRGFHIPSALFTHKQALTPAMHMPERHPHSNKHSPPATNAERCGKAPSPEPWEERFFLLTGSPLCLRGASEAARSTQSRAGWKGLPTRAVRALGLQEELNFL